MAVTLVLGKGKINLLEHHRSPSGINNKANWLVSKSKRDVIKLRCLWDKIVMDGYKMNSSWHKAFYMAEEIIHYNFKNAKELEIYHKAHEDREYLCHLLGENFKLHNENVIYKTVLEKYHKIDEVNEIKEKMGLK